MKHLLPAVRARDEARRRGANAAEELVAAAPGMTRTAGVEDAVVVDDGVQRARFVAHFGGLLASLSGNPHINRNGGERLRAMRTLDPKRNSVLHGVRLHAAMGAGVHVDVLRKGASVIRYCTDAQDEGNVLPGRAAARARPEGSWRVAVWRRSLGTARTALMRRWLTGGWRRPCCLAQRFGLSSSFHVLDSRITRQSFQHSCS